MDLSKHRKDFPILSREINGRSLVYLDSAATSLKPQPVIDAVLRFYTQYTANVHRAVHALSVEATEAFENARRRIARFIHAESEEIAFVRHATEAINIVAHGFRDRGIVAAPLGEHHSNLLPWQAGTFVALPMTPAGQINLEKATEIIRERKPGLIAFSSISNALGIRQPVAELVALAREVSARILLDLSQEIGHRPVDVDAIDCDFACFSGHKMLGPGGVGVLYCRKGTEPTLPPLLLGGSMIQEVHAESYLALPYPLGMEAGTPNIEGVIGLAAACDYLDGVGLENIRQHGEGLLRRAKHRLQAIKNIDLHGNPENESENILAFSVRDVPAHTVAKILSDEFGIMVRSGYHCAQPLHESCGLPETVRLSIHLYNTQDDIDRLTDALAAIVEMT